MGGEPCRLEIVQCDPRRSGKFVALSPSEGLDPAERRTESESDPEPNEARALPRWAWHPRPGPVFRFQLTRSDLERGQTRGRLRASQAASRAWESRERVVEDYARLHSKNLPLESLDDHPHPAILATGAAGIR